MKQSMCNTKRSILAIFIILLLMSMAGCGNRGIANLDVSHIANPDRTLFYGETLTIATVFGGQEPSPYQSLAKQYMAANPGVTIEVINLRPYTSDADRFANKRDEIGVQLMAGSAPVLIDGAFVDHRDPRSAHFFVDWFSIMDADPSFNEDDWFMNVFHASAVNDRLLAFPLLFHREMVTANSTIPDLPEALAVQDSITLSELMELHRKVSTDTSFLFAPYFGASRVVTLYLDSFLDMDTGLVDFNNEQFIDLIAYAREITGQNMTDERYWIDPELEVYWSENYFFYISDFSMYQDLPHLETGPLFTELTPLVNERGELLVDTSWSTYVLSANATPVEQALAWDFIQFVMNPDNRDTLVHMQPTNRHLFHHGAVLWLRHTIGTTREDFGWQLLTDTIDESVEDVKIRMEALGDMPMANTRTLPFAIENIIDEALELFHNGLVSAEQTAADLQNRVTLALMEMGIN